MASPVTITPRAHRYAFQIWRFCEPLGWNVTLQDIAGEIGLPPNHVSHILNQKGWGSRVRAYRKDYQIGIDAYSHIGSHTAGVSVEFDEAMG